LRNHGTDPKTRGLLFDERLEAVKALWTAEPAEYHGDFVDFDPAHSRPKPVQKPHPPIFIGGGSDAAVRRIVRHGAGWISIPLPPKSLRKRIDQMRDSAGHDVPLAMVFAADDLEYWDATENLGFSRLGLQLPTQPLDESLRLLDDYALKVAQYRS
jgi:alkanesulfonate monooxygenase SsuD/methylene tetrahydromethanopterin reductase-like flavin-dependent oxidoreductase (luciferase family)